VWFAPTTGFFFAIEKGAVVAGGGQRQPRQSMVELL
jgi:hypothetical protein